MTRPDFIRTFCCRGKYELDLMVILLAGIVVLATHIPLDAQVLKRGIVFIDLAIAQIAGGYALGLVLSVLLDLPSGALIVWCLALLAMLVYACGPKPPQPA